MKVLLIATRDVGGRRYGRKVVLWTIINSLRRAGHEVVVAAFIPKGQQLTPLREGVTSHGLKLPSMVRVLWTIVTWCLTRRLSLNEALFYSPSSLATAHRIARDCGADLVIADMIRTVPHAQATGLPWIVDLDDLLSERYAAMASRDRTPEMLLGFYSPFVPAVVRPLAMRVAGALLRFEAAILRAREVQVARRASGVCLVSSLEQERLALAANVRVDWLPMAVDTDVAAADALDRRPATMVFVGGLDYQPNLDAIRWYCAEVAPALRRIGLAELRLSVIGYVPPALQRAFPAEDVVLLSYVEDLHAALAAAQLFVAPIVSGTGIKTKVLEAMASGLPIVSTEEGVRGLNVESGRECLIAADGPSMARAIKSILDDPEAAKKIAASGRTYVAANFSPSIVSRRWSAVITRAIARGRIAGNPPPSRVN